MNATRHRIISRKKLFPAAVCQTSDFELSAGDMTCADGVLESDRWSLYCVDFEERIALFVELPSATDLSTVPFMYMTQYDTATQAIAVPLDSLADMADGVALPQGSALILSTGRCGSTLASKMLAQLPDVWSVSEPDAFTNLALEKEGPFAHEIDRLVGAVARLSFHRPGAHSDSIVVLKPRSEAAVLAESLGRQIPDAKILFLYRDAFGYVNSAYRFAQRILGAKAFFGDPNSWREYWSIATINAPIERLKDYFPQDHHAVGHVDILTLMWFLRMRSYGVASDVSARMTPIHYDDLNGDRDTTTSHLLAGCGISPTHVDLAMRAFEKDAHAGSAGANAVSAVPIDDRAHDRISELLARWGTPAFKTERLPSERS